MKHDESTALSITIDKSLVLMFSSTIVDILLIFDIYRTIIDINKEAT